MSTYRALIVGAGGMGKAWAHNIASYEETTLVGWCDVIDGAAKKAAEQANADGVATGTDYAKMLDELRPDFVIDVTPPEAHRDVVIHALDCGYPVLGEKPLADSMESARAMVAAADRSGKLYMVSQSRRYNAGIQAYRELLKEVGELGILNVDFYLGPHFGGFRDEMDSPLVLDMAIHTFDAARYISGQDPVAVFCHEWNPSWSWYQGAACANATFEMTGGVRFAYRGSWCAEGKNTSWEGSWRAVSSKGSALWDGDKKVDGDLVVGTGGFMHDTKYIHKLVKEEGFYGGIAGSIREFIHSLKTGETPNGECHDNIKSLAMVFGAILSAKTSKRVHLENDDILID